MALLTLTAAENKRLAEYAGVYLYPAQVGDYGDSPNTWARDMKSALAMYDSFFRGTNGQLLIGNATTGYATLTTLTAGAGITVTNGAGSITIANTNPNPMTTVGDLITGGAAGAPGRLAVGTTSQVLTIASGAPYLAAPAAPVPTTAATGGTVAAGTYTVGVTYVNAQGETVSSSAGTVTTTGTTSTVTVPSPAASGTGAQAATGWYAYVSQAGLTTLYRQQAAGSPTAIGTGLTLIAPPTTTGAGVPGANTAASRIPVWGAAGAGTVTSVTGTAPIVSSGGATPAISITAATTAAPGSVQLAGDLAGTGAAPIVAKINGTSVPATPTSGQVLTATSGTAATWQTPAASGVSSVTGTAPIVSSGGATPAISISDATTAAKGAVQLAGDIAGTATAVVVAKVNGTSVPATPTAGQVLTATSGTAATWQAPAGGAPSGTASGDLSGTYPGPTVAKVNGIAVTGTPGVGQIITATSATAATWQNAASGFTNPMTTAGDLILGGASGAAGRLGVGATGQVLTVAGGTAAWSNPTGGSGTAANSGPPPVQIAVTNSTGSTIAANKAVNIYNNAGVLSMRLADLTTANNDYEVSGFTAASVPAGTNGPVQVDGILSGFSGLTSGQYYGDTAAATGGITATVPATADTYSQKVGFAVSSSQLNVKLETAVKIAGVNTAPAPAAAAAISATSNSAARTGQLVTATNSSGATIGANLAVNLYDNAGVLTMRLADTTAGGTARDVVGFTVASAANAATASVQLDGVLAGFTGLTSGVYYSDPSAVAGGITTTVPSISGQRQQKVGFAISSTELFIKIGDAVQLA